MMKLISSFALFCTFLFYVDAHVVYKEPGPGWAGWSLIKDPICRRPASGECSKAGSCCVGTQRRTGTQRVTRECVEGHCEGAELEYTRTCNIRCRESDKDAYGPWEPDGECELPATGECSERKPVGHECCGKLLGKIQYKRECKAAKGCESAALQRYYRCNVRCVPAEDLTPEEPEPEEPEWSTWADGGCSVTCGAGTQTYTRTCPEKNKCEGPAEKTENCNKGACAEWTTWSAGDCSATCGEGTLKYTRTCEGLGDCDGDSEKTETCNAGECADWTTWSAGDCSAACGEGTLKYTRTCEGLGDCDGDSEKTETCNAGECVTCSKPGAPYKGQAVCKTPNGDILGENEPLQTGTECHYSCADGLSVTPTTSTTLTCTSTGEWDQPEPCCRKTQCDVKEYMDLLFIVDISKSMYSGKGEKQRWFAARKFLIEFVSSTHFTIGPDNVRVGIIPFFKEPDISQQILFSQTTTKEKLVQDIEGLQCCYSGTNQSYAMNHAVDNMLTTENGDRSEAINMLVVMTDGVPSGNLPDDVKLKQVHDAGSRLRPMGATYGIGISLSTKGDADLANGVMDAITGPKFPENKILVDDGGELTEMTAAIIDNVIDAACNACVEPED